MLVLTTITLELVFILSFIEMIMIFLLMAWIKKLEDSIKKLR